MRAPFLFYLILILSINKTYSQNEPVSKRTDEMVDLFTGDFKYQVQLLAVPGPNGENVPLVASYRGGIKMEDEASWIGLGWDLNPGEIVHQVKGVSDDSKEILSSVYFYNGEQTNTLSQNLYSDTYDYGPLYFKDFESASDVNSSSMDVCITSGAGYEGNYHAFPDYDSYFVNAPGLNAEMTLRLLEYDYLKMKVDGEYFTYSDPSSFTKTPQFAMKGDFYSQLIPPYNMDEPARSTGGYNVLTLPPWIDDHDPPPFNEPRYYWLLYDTYKGTSYAPGVYNIFVPPRAGISNINEDYEGSGYQSGNNRLKGSHFVKYYTNSQLSGASLPTDYLDFNSDNVSTNYRNESDYANLISAIQITNPEGMTYHFSLPVYAFEERSFAVLLDQNGDPDLSKEDGLSLFISDKPYVYSYKLTAITGPDYKDLNHNQIADDGDTGYWISYLYGEWTNNFRWSVPFYNYSKTLHSRLADRYYTRKSSFNHYDPGDIEYKDQGSGGSGKKQIVYLNAIQTSTHTAIFLKEPRIDGISKQDAAIYPTDVNLKPISQLKLSKIVLLNNENLNLISKSSSINLDSRFDINSVSPSNIYKIDDYLSNQNTIKNKALKIIDFVTDYSLSNLVYNNINNTFSKSLKNYAYCTQVGTPQCDNVIVPLYQKVIPESCTQTNNRGKLTLKEIEMHEIGGVTINPSYLFDYTSAGVSNNPNYNPDARDFWGYFKSDRTTNGDYTGLGYLTHDFGSFSGSKNNVQAWSLSRITLPSGAEIEVEYECDEFSKINYEAESGRPSNVTRTFLTKNLTTGNVYPNLEFEFDIDHTGESMYLSNELASINLVLRGALTLPTLNYFGFFRADNLGGSSNDPLQISYGANKLSGHIPFVPQNWIGHQTPVSFSNNFTWQAQNYSFVEFQMSKGYGGGLRVRSIGIKDPHHNVTYRTKYDYGNGVATHEPDLFAKSTLTLNMNLSSGDRDCPIPMVGYSSVSVTSLSVDDRDNGKEVFYFETDYERKKLSFNDNTRHNGSGTLFGHVYDVTVLRCYNASQFGLPTQKMIYDKHGSLLLMKKNYYEKKNSITELFFEKFTFASREYQKISMRTDETFKLTTEHLYHDGVKHVTEYSSWDEYTGQPGVIKSSNPFEGYTEIQNIPAYHTYASLGSKFDSENNTNQTLFEGKKTILKGGLDQSWGGKQLANNVQIVDGVKTTYQDDINMRMFNVSTSKFVSTPDPNQLYRPVHVKKFNGSTDDANWVSQNQINLIDPRGNVLETESSLGTFSSVKYGYNSMFRITEAAGASYESVAFTSFEDRPANSDYYGGEIHRGDGDETSANGFETHTGKKVGRLLPTDEYGPSFKTDKMQTGRTYRTSIWVLNNNQFNPAASLIMQLNGSHAGNPSNPIDVSVSKRFDSPENIVCGDWMQVNLDIEVPEEYVPSNGPGALNDLRAYIYNPAGASGTCYLDDFSFRPINANITNYVYDEFTGFNIAVLNNENFASYFEYDAAGRLIRTHKETLQGVIKVSENTYHQFR